MRVCIYIHIYSLVNGTQTGLRLGGGLGIRPRGVSAAASPAIMYTHTHIIYKILTFFPAVVIGSASFYPILSMTKMCYFVHATGAAVPSEDFQTYFFFLLLFRTRNPPPYKRGARLYLHDGGKRIGGYSVWVYL